MNKRVVTSTGLQEQDIRPKEVMSEFLRLSIADAAEYFGDASVMDTCACPACENSESEIAFEKQGFAFRRCADCRSLYVSPRPSEQAIARYYETSEAAAYRTHDFARETSAQRKGLARDRAQWIARVLDESGATLPATFCEFAPRSLANLDAVARLESFERVCATATAPAIAESLRAAEIAATPETDTNVSAFAAFEALERAASPASVLDRACKLLSHGGLFFATTRTGDGFDLQVLGEHARYIVVPEHLNLLSIDGLERLVARAGLELIELSTPGQLDVELVLGAVEENPDIQLPPFARELLLRRGAVAHSDFQAFLQQHRLSSHARIAARKPEVSV